MVATISRRFVIRAKLNQVGAFHSRAQTFFYRIEPSLKIIEFENGVRVLLVNEPSRV